jgi:hypothetical protein
MSYTAALPFGTLEVPNSGYCSPKKILYEAPDFISICATPGTTGGGAEMAEKLRLCR